TWRSLALMSPVDAMTATLTGKTLIARKAKSQGLIDVVTEERHFAEAVRWAVGGKLSPRKGPGLLAKAMSIGPARSFLAQRMEGETAKKAKRAHYPAPYAMIDLWRRFGDDPAAMRRAETDSFARLLLTDTSRNLVRCFFLRERLKGYAKGARHGVRHVHVIGAGVMGGDIAAWSALRGFRVTLEDREIKYIAPAIGRARELFRTKLYTDGDRRAAFDRLMPDPKGYGIRSADLIIEAVPENPEIKQAVFSRCEAAMKPTAILASNTSSLLLQTLAEKLKRPERFCGIHFFNPVPQMPLVELVTHPGLDGEIRARGLAFIDALDKLPLPVHSAPGFLVNRALTPYMMEAFLLYSEGVEPEVIDAVAENFGMPMGPIELADRVGLDVGLHVAKVLKRDLSNRPLPDIPDWFEKLVADGKLGSKSGQGLYAWENGKPKKKPAGITSDPRMEDRLILPLLNAVADCLHEGIVEDADAADAGMIFGTGFAPFRGGPIHYAKARGVAEVVAVLESLRAKHGERFAPSPGWAALR
ncbi:MAG: 3-hydroxyacyl-CoA dehydrogenase family protein, partial [Parvibaculaceae bacterium]